MTTLDDVTLPADLQWIDEALWCPVEAVKEYSLAGSLIIDEGTKLAGRPITLAGGENFAWSTWETVTTLMAMAAIPGSTMTLTLDDGREFSVRFDHASGPPVIPTAIDDINPPRPEHKYFFTLKLIEV